MYIAIDERGARYITYITYMQCMYSRHIIMLITGCYTYVPVCYAIVLVSQQVGILSLIVGNLTRGSHLYICHTDELTSPNKGETAVCV